MKIDTLANVKNQISTVIEHLGDEPLFITRNGKVAAVLQAVSDDGVEDYLLRNSPSFWRLIASRRAQAESGDVLAFHPTRYGTDEPGISHRVAVREKAVRYKVRKPTGKT